MTVARLGPASAIRKKNSAMASALHASPSTTSASTTFPDGTAAAQARALIVFMLHMTATPCRHQQLPDLRVTA